MTATIHHGDCLDVLREMPDNSVDAVICDPPYGLSNTTPDKVTDTIVRWAQGDREHVPTGKGFMGASWDAFVPPVAVWDECLRVLKPGGHLVAFAGSRTQDLMGLAIRLAGFDIRENLAWLYGSGFPKSLDVGKAIDKRPGVVHHKRFAAHLAEKREASGLSRADVSEAVTGTRTGACWNWEHHQFPEAKWWPALRDLLKLDDEPWSRIIEEADREVIGKSAHKSGIGNGTKGHHTVGGTIAEAYDITAPGTPEAEKWQGWGTALKPGHEPIILARKPLGGRTVAANTLEWGTGGINVDACRIGTTGRPLREKTGATPPGSSFDTAHTKARGEKANTQGRWPANVVLDPDTAEVLDQQSGTSKSQKINATGGGAFMRGGYRSMEELRAAAERDEVTPDGAHRARATLARHEAESAKRKEYGYADEGGASRFFKVVEPDPPFMYAAKAPKRERPSYTTEDGTTVQHSTVKPLSIMSWLVKLVTPEGGTVLDPFAGSGTTVEAALIEGFNVIGIECEDAYLPLIQQRIDRAAEKLPAA